MKEITRVFHPVGQGAFYSERLIFDNEVVNVVYDCGATTYFGRRTEEARNVVSRSFSKSDVIDILFISHLDEDHVNEIPTLIKSVHQIKCIVLPLLVDEARNFLIATYKMLMAKTTKKELEHYGLLLKLLGEASSSKLLKDTKIVGIKSQNEKEIDTEPEKIKIIDISELYQGDDNITRGTGIKVADDWIFVPFNYDYEKTRRELLERLRQYNMYDKVLEGDIENILSDENDRKALKKIYQGLKKKNTRTTSINFNSMLLYSGPQSELYNNWSIMRIRYFTGFHYFSYMGCCMNRSVCCDLRNKPACIYTGDTDINVVEISSVFKNWIDIVGTIQIPHHGAMVNFNINQIPPRTICPVSVGIKNRYKHPHNFVLIELFKKECLPVLVTEDESSGFIEIIG